MDEEFFKMKMVTNTMEDAYYDAIIITESLPKLTVIENINPRNHRNMLYFILSRLL